MTDLRFTSLREGQRHGSASAVLCVEHLTVKVGMRRVIEDLSLKVYDGDAICISGPNGSGKSTLLNAISGLDPARVESGTILFGGEDVTRLPTHERASRGLAYLRQRENVFTDLTVDENLRLALGANGPSRFQAQFPEWAANLPGRRRSGILSGGQKQRLAWAMAVLRSRRLLLADEPEAGMAQDVPLPDGTVLLVSHTAGQWKGEPE